MQDRVGEAFVLRGWHGVFLCGGEVGGVVGWGAGVVDLGMVGEKVGMVWYGIV